MRIPIISMCLIISSVLFFPVVLSAEEQGSQVKSDAAGDSIIVYYFYGKVRCPTCHKIETYTQETMTGLLSEYMKLGRLQWKPINTEEAGNEHFEKDYQLFTKSVIVSEIKNGKETRWKNLGKIWDLTGDKPEFQKYIQDEVMAYLEGK